MKRKREDLTYEEVYDLLSYDPLTGDLAWRVRRNGTRGVGSAAGGVSNPPEVGNQYLRVRIKGFRYKAHRIGFLLMTGNWPKDQIDHIDHDGLNNQWDNLREVTHSENGKNRTRPKNNKTGVVGVSFRKDCARKWQSRIRVDGTLIHLGFFHSLEDAIAARKAAEIKYGFHPNHGK